jgi:diguanylate cyclase (GGDEF)-like protein
MEDPLTGLGNRRAFDKRLMDEADNLSGETSIAMVIIDIDQFKSVNDRFGHACGDAVLCRVGDIVRSVLRPDDLALRLGGDEFCAVLSGAAPQVVHDRADRIGALVTLEDWGLLALGLDVTVSVGAASAVGPTDIADLYPRADAALYAAKAAGPGLLRIAN